MRYGLKCFKCDLQKVFAPINTKGQKNLTDSSIRGILNFSLKACVKEKKFKDQSILPQNTRVQRDGTRNTAD